MHLLTDYVQPLTLWLYANPNWAFFITALISFAESLAIIGSIIPGSVTMTAIGILAGSGVLNIEMTFFSAILGAIAGDTASYALGYIFSDHIEDMWPFHRYPQWLHYGKDYFDRHGGKSVVIGRFFGPLRSIIPVIAGMLHMNRWYFLFANIVSAIGWAFLYIMPGVLIGAASSELSAERATRLFMLILALLVATWGLSLGLKWIFRHINHALQAQLNRIWSMAERRPLISRFIQTLKPRNEPNGQYATENLIVISFFFFLLTTAVILLVMQGTWFTSINHPSYLFLQSLRTQSFDAFFIVIGFFVHPSPLFAFACAVALYAFYCKDWRLLRYWISLCISCGILTGLLASSINIPIPNVRLHQRFMPAFPVVTLTLATALFGFLIAYTQACHRTVSLLIFRGSLIVILLVSGLALLYLGENWVTSVLAAYLIGVTWSLLYWILFRRTMTGAPVPAHDSRWMALTGLIFLATTVTTSARHFKQAVYDHALHHQQFILSEQAWWTQGQQLLPTYMTNRIGQRIGLFNIQYLGTLDAFEHALSRQGWKTQNDSLFYSLRLRAGGLYSAKKLPLMAQLYLNKKPDLIMTYPFSKGHDMYVLRLWRSNYHVRHHSKPIWLGSIIYLQSASKARKNHPNPSMHFTQILKRVHGFESKITTLPHQQMKELPASEQPEIMIMKESASNS